MGAAFGTSSKKSLGGMFGKKMIPKTTQETKNETVFDATPKPAAEIKSGDNVDAVAAAETKEINAEPKAGADLENKPVETHAAAEAEYQLRRVSGPTMALLRENTSP